MYEIKFRKIIKVIIKILDEEIDVRVLLVEDDELLGDATQTGLVQSGYTVDWVKDGVAATRALDAETFDLVILDLGLPLKDGIAVLKDMRTKGNQTSVLILTALDQIEDRIKGLDAGADDYMSKPYDLDELCARLRALERRASGRAEPTISYGPIEINPAAHTVSLESEPVNLSRREFVLLTKLLENTGRVLSRDQLMQSLYGWSNEIDSNALEVHIHNLRKKFGNQLIRTIRGIGYMVEKT
ncbi:response regulator transcription factor [Piscirickettsia salmonis]|uniref:response regulator transcription factor n=2 Tax=Bacteria TaxID=2 RepID=UPI002E1D3D79